MPADDRPLAVFLMGPTASGKTALACELVTRFGMDIVSVDSAQVYRGMNIGTAKPDAAMQARFPHALIDIRDIADAYSAGDFRNDATVVMQRMTSAGRIPLLVGGTGLYFRALQQGLSSLPAADPIIRERLTAEAGRIGWPALHARLTGIDPIAAARIKPTDAQRIQRALEVIEVSGGQTLTQLQQATATHRFPWRVLKLALVPQERSWLHDRIAARFDAMLADGFLDEVRDLLAGGPPGCADLPAWRSVGYRQARDYLEGHGNAAEFRDRAIAATRQLAKRQITWIRGTSDVITIDPRAADCMQRVVGFVAQFSDRSGSA